MGNSRFSVSGDQYRSIDRLARDLFHKLDHKNGSRLDPDLVRVSLRNIVAGKFNEAAIQATTLPRTLMEKTAYLKLIHEGEAPFIPPIDCIKRELTFGVFSGGGYKDLIKADTARPVRATTSTRVSVYELLSDACPRKMFQSFGVPLDELCLSQNQIIFLCRNYPAWLHRAGYGNFFLTSNDESRPPIKENLGIVTVQAKPNGLEAYIDPYLDAAVCPAYDRPRLFVPQVFES